MDGNAAVANIPFGIIAMKKTIPTDAKTFLAACVLVAVALVIVCLKPARAQSPDSSLPQTAGTNSAAAEPSLDLPANQLDAIKIETLGTQFFVPETEVVGSVAYYQETETNSVPVNPEIKSIIASIGENDAPAVRVGQPVTVKVAAYPDKTFTGKVAALGGTVWDGSGNPAVDPNTRRVTARCEIADPDNELFPGMFATVRIQVRAPVEAAALPVNGAVRNDDGTMAAWVTTDRKHFSMRLVRLGLEREGFYQVLGGLRAGEQAVTDGAIFLNNILYAPPSD